MVPASNPRVRLSGGVHETWPRGPVNASSGVYAGWGRFIRPVVRHETFRRCNAGEASSGHGNALI